MNRDMEEKGIVLRELSCRTAAELPAPELPDCRRQSCSAAGSPAVYSGAELPPKLSGCSGGCPLGAEKSRGVVLPLLGTRSTSPRLRDLRHTGVEWERLLRSLSPPVALQVLTFRAPKFPSK
ncbi:unnamed protein product [Boreogadus saida]